jgi:hypothetical protein
MIAMTDMTNAELVDQFNKLAAQTPSLAPLKQWKSKKSDLIKKIKRLKASVQSQGWEAFRRDTIRDTSLALLCHIVETNEDDRSVGLPYKEIVEIIHELHDNSKTSIECLRWYAVKIRAEEEGYEGIRLPQIRPRNSKAKEDEES